MSDAWVVLWHDVPLLLYFVATFAYWCAWLTWAIARKVGGWE